MKLRAIYHWTSRQFRVGITYPNGIKCAESVTSKTPAQVQKYLFLAISMDFEVSYLCHP
jgi:hypothetical protein